VAWWLLNLAVAAGVSETAVAVYGRPRGWVATGAWLLALTAVSCTTLAALRPLTVRLVPLQGLLRLSLAFPEQAPSRFRTALRAGNPKLVLRDADDTLGRRDTLLPGQAARSIVELTAALSVHDAATRGHSERVRAYAELIGEELGLDPEARQGLRWAGLVHDVGKLFVPAEILNKPGALSPEEWVVVRRHPADGAELARPLEPWLGEWAAGVLEHHERWDGHGYPRRLAGTDISLAGRIVAVADAYDVMTSSRSYKKPTSPSKAREELVRCAGTQFDPMVVRAFLALSVRKVRAVAGILPAALAELSWLRWTLRPRLGRVVVPLVGGTTAVTVGLLASLPPVPGAHASRPAVAPALSATPPAVSTTPANAEPPAVPTASELTAVTTSASPAANGAGGGAGSAVPPPAAPTSSAGPLTAGSAPSSAPDLGAGPVPPAGAEGDQPSGDQPSHGGPAPSGGSGGSGPSGGNPAPGAGQPNPNASLVVDPADGSVSLDNLGPAGTPPLPVVQVPAAGGVACGAVQVCSPVSVPLPIP